MMVKTLDKLLSLCMIVKDEEKLLPRCLDSVKGLVDEIIIVDTGSTDQTKQIAEAFTTHVYDFEWCNDFSAARNESLKYASGKWVLILDADEYVQSMDFSSIRQMLLSHDTSLPYGFITTILNFTGTGYDESMLMESSGARIFNNHSEIRYTQPIHEQLTSINKPITFSNLPLKIFHSGYTKEVVIEKNKSDRNMSILKTMANDSPNQAYYYFTLGNEYSNAEQLEEALQAYQTSFQSSSPSDTWFDHLLNRLISVELQLGFYKDAYTHILMGMEHKPDSTDYHCLYGILLDTLGYLNEAESKFLECLQIAEAAARKQVPHWVTNPSYGISVPLEMIADINRKKGNIPNAITYWFKTLQAQPKNFTVLKKWIDHVLTSGAAQQLQPVLDMIYPDNKPINAVLLYKLSLLTGNMDMMRHYRSIIPTSLSLTYQDELLFNLLTKSNNTLTPSNEQVDMYIGLMASVIYDDSRFASSEVRPLAIQIANLLHGRQWQQPDLTGKEKTLADFMLLLYKMNYKEHYFSIIQEVADAKCISLLGESFFQEGNMENALEIYSLLLKHGQLNSEGLATIAQWHFNFGEMDEGINFLKLAVEYKAPVHSLGMIHNYITVDQRGGILKKYDEHHPDLIGFTISK